MHIITYVHTINPRAAGAERIRADEAGAAVRAALEERDRALAERDTARSEVTLERGAKRTIRRS